MKSFLNTLLFLLLGAPTIALGQDLYNLEFSKNVKLKSKGVTSVIYGHPSIGFFKTEDIKRKQGYLEFKIIPPTYVYPVVFYGKDHSGSFKILGRKNFKSPLPKAFDLIKFTVQGTFTKPYFLLSGSLPKYSLSSLASNRAKPNLPFKNKNRFSFPMIVNRIGEIVWAYVPSKEGKPFNSYIVTKPVRKGVYGVLAGKKQSYFLSVRADGRVLKSIDLRSAKGAAPLHHDFAKFNGKEFYSLGYSKKRYGTKKTYLTSTVVKVDLIDNKMTSLWDFGDSFHPYKNQWKEETEDKTHFVHWNQTDADHDLTHANKITFGKRGALISFRHLNRIGLFSLEKKKFHWTLGPSEENTIQAVGKAEFSFQHSPFFNKEGQLILFDNGVELGRSRVIALDIEGDKARLAWEFPKNSKFFSKNRGSVSQLDTGNLVSLFVSPQIVGKKPAKYTRSDYLMEFDPLSGQEVGRMKITFLSKSPGYRTVPLSSLGKESFVSLSKKLW